jgi:PAS domain S-box-containing protein
MSSNDTERPRPPDIASGAPPGSPSWTHRAECDGACGPATLAHPIEASFQQFAELLTDLVWSARPDGDTDFYNRSFLDYLGTALDPVRDRIWAEALHPDDVEGGRRAWQDACTTGGEFDVEYRIRRHDGQYRWHRCHATPMRDVQGRILRWFGTCTDIDEAKRAADELTQGEERLRMALEAGRMGTWDWDLRTGEVAWSANMEEIHGLPEGGFDGTIEGFRRLVHPDDRDRVEATIARSIEERSAYEVEFRFERPDGSVGWMLGKGRVLADRGGQPTRMLGAAMDITGRKLTEQALRQSEQRFARFMQHLPGLAWIKDPQGRYVYANDAAERAFRIPRPELYGKTDDDVFPPETATQFREHDRRALSSGAGVQVIETLEHEDGVLHHSLVSKFPIPSPDGEGVLVGGMAIDVTDRLRAEEALKEADRRKGEFLATLAHELRNPLAPIRNALRLMKHSGEQGDLETERAMAERQVVHLARLVDDLMDIARINQGRIELRKEALDLAPVVKRAVQAIQSSIEGRGHALSISLPPEPVRLVADPTRLEQVIWNLLSNAAKYTEPGGQIRLSVRQEGGWVALRVRDTGMGIEPEMLSQIFGMFIQADGRRDRSQSGLGIGLSLVKTLVEMHGGDVAAWSGGPGQGSEVVVRFPVPSASETTQGQAEPDQPERSLSGTERPCRRILVVDDNEDAATSLARLLRRVYGHEVRVAHDGPEALGLAGEFRPEVVLLDIGMPGMDGYEVARRMRVRADLAGVRIIALTGWGQDSDRHQSREAGFDYHLVKPVDPETLSGLLASPTAEV